MNNLTILTDSAQAWARLSNLANIIYICFAFLAFAATGAVVYVSWRAGNVSSRLQSAKDVAATEKQAAQAKEIAVLNTKAAALYADTEKAKEGMAKANAQIAEAGARSEEAKADSAKANAQSAETKKGAAEANERAQNAITAQETLRQNNIKLATRLNESIKELEREHIERLKLEAKLRPRSINHEDQRKLLTILKSAPKGRVVVVPKVFDEEAENYAAQISNVLKDAGYTIEPWKGQRPFSFSRSGAFIWVRNMSKPPMHAAGIQHAFKGIGVTLDGYGNPDVVPDTDTVIIAVAVKP